MPSLEGQTKSKTFKFFKDNFKTKKKGNLLCKWSKLDSNNRKG